MEKNILFEYYDLKNPYKKKHRFFLPHCTHVANRFVSTLTFLREIEKCLPSFEQSPGVDPECSVMEGRFTLYLVDRSYEADMRKLARDYVKSIVNDGLLNDASPVILDVSFIDEDSNQIQPRNPIMEGDDDLDVPEIVLTIDSGIWYTIGGCLVGLTAIGVVLRYRYVSKFDDNGDLIGDDVEPDENFIDEVRRAVIPQGIETLHEQDIPQGNEEVESASPQDVENSQVQDNLSWNEEVESVSPQDIETSQVQNDVSGDEEVGSASLQDIENSQIQGDVSGNEDVGSVIPQDIKTSYVYDLSGSGD